LIALCKDLGGKRVYLYKPLPAADLKAIRCCVLHGMGLSALTKHVP
jgi:hypothetical protein